VLPLVVSGLFNKQAAAELGISDVTLQLRRDKIMQKGRRSRSCFPWRLTRRHLLQARPRPMEAGVAPLMRWSTIRASAQTATDNVTQTAARRS
jgi:hypothetical protein